MLYLILGKIVDITNEGVRVTDVTGKERGVLAFHDVRVPKAVRNTVKLFPPDDGERPAVQVGTYVRFSPDTGEWCLDKPYEGATIEAYAPRPTLLSGLRLDRRPRRKP